MNPPLKERIALAWDILRGRFAAEMLIGKAFMRAFHRSAENRAGTLQQLHFGRSGGVSVQAHTLRPAEELRPERGSGTEGNHFTLGDYYVHLISIIDHGKGRSVLYRRAHDPKGTVRRMGLQAWSKKAKPA